MLIRNLNHSNTQAYTHSAYVKQVEMGYGAEVVQKKGDSGTLHIENALAAAKIVEAYDIQDISPRDMADLSNSLFMAGLISREENNILGFQPELHPDYDSIIGEQTGTLAAPDEKRDYLKIWKEKKELYQQLGNIKEMVNSGRMVTILENLHVLNQ